MCILLCTLIISWQHCYLTISRNGTSGGRSTLPPYKWYEANKQYLIGEAAFQAIIFFTILTDDLLNNLFHPQSRLVIRIYSNLFIRQTQFCLAFLHNCLLLFYDCNYPKWSVILVLPNAMFFYFLFSDFYNNAYTSKKKNDDATSIQKANGFAEKVSSDEIPNGKGKND